MQFKKVFKGMLIAVPMVTLMACSSTDSNQVSEAEAAAAAQAQAEQERKAREEAEAAAQAQALQERKRIEMETMQNELDALQRNQVVYFDFDKSSIRSDAYSTLDKHAEFLSKNPTQSIVIEGHCDHRGTPEYNIALGERRAQAIETYLQNAGVSPSQISVVSYGEEKPAVSGSTEAAFQKNRRGVLVYQ